jgi:iron complex outermembrane recepter protein
MKFTLFKTFLSLLLLTSLVLPFSKLIASSPDESIEFVIRDAATTQPIAHVLYRYGSQQGSTPVDGRIILRLQEDTRLELSHLSYGFKTLSNAELRQTAADGAFYWRERTTQMQPVTVVSVRPGEQSRTVLDLETGDKLSHDAGSFLQNLAAFSGVRKSGGYGFDPVLRGFKYDQLNIVIDGSISASAACPNRMDPPTSQIAMNMVERVEVLKGPYALRYGNSFGGTINFISAEPDFTGRPTPYGRLSGSTESNKAVYRYEAVTGLRTSRSDVSLFGSWSQADSYTDGQGQRISSGFERGSYGLKAAVQPAKGHRANLSLQRNVASNTEFASLPMDLITDETWLGNLTWQYTPSPHTQSSSVHNHGGLLHHLEANVWFSYVDHFMSNELRDLNPRMVNAGTLAETLNFGARSEAQLNLLRGGTTYLGIDFRSEQAEGIREREMLMGPMAGRTLFDNAWQKSRIQTAGLFSEVQQSAGDYRYVVSARLDLNHAEALNPDGRFLAVNEDLTVTQLNPSVSAGVIRSWNGALETGIWAGRSVRSAGITERYINFFPVGLDPYEMLGNPMLRQEVNHQIDIITSWNSPSMRAEVNVYQAHINNYISSRIDPDLAPRMATAPGVRRYLNVDRAWIAGVEVSINQLLGNYLNHAAQLAWTYGENLDTDEALPEIAPLDLRYRMGATLWEGRVRPEVSFRYVRAQDRVAASFGELPSETFTRVDASVAVQPIAGAATGGSWRNVSMVIGVQNLFDVAYYEHLSRNIAGVGRPIYEPGRNIYLTLAYRF